MTSQIPFKVLIAGGGALLAGLLCSCTTPPSVLTLSQQSAANNKLLAQQHTATTTSFSKFTSDTEDRENALVDFATLQQKKLKEIATLALRAEVTAAEQELTAEINGKCLDLATTQFEKALSEKFDAAIQPTEDKLLALVQTQKTNADAHPNDNVARAQYLQAVTNADGLALKVVDQEVILRTQLLKTVAAAQLSLQGEIATAFKSIHSQLDQTVAQVTVDKILNETADASSASNHVTYAAIRTQISAYDKDVQKGFAAQDQVISTMDSYLKRPSEIQLVLNGVASAVQTSVDAELAKLGPIGAALKAPADQLLSNIEGSISQAVTNVSQKIDTTVNSAAASMSQQAATAATTALKTQPAQ